MKISRRGLLVGAAGTAAATIFNSRNILAALPADDPYYLSASNPIANVDQREIEDIALRLIRQPEVQRAREQAAKLWLAVTAHTAGPQISRFEAMMDEYTFNYALKAANADASRPRVLRSYVPPAHWFDRDLPGSRWGGDNPDNAYRLIPIAPEGRYELHGRRMPGGIAYVSYTLVGNAATSVTLSSLEGRDVRHDPDGRFVITIDGRPAEGRTNHLQNKPGALFLFIRDSMGDWEHETPNALRIQRLDAVPSPPPSDEQRALLAAKWMVDDVYLLYWFTRLNYASPVNVVRTPHASGAVGGLRTQVGSQAAIRLASDEAMIITANAAGAAYRNAVLHDIWYRTIEYWNRQSSLNPGQMTADADGQYTYVVAHEDPGSANWLDTGGLDEVYFLQRWQGLPPDMAESSAPRIRSEVVKFKDLETRLPAGVARITPSQRTESLQRRRAAYQRRFLDT